MIREYFRNAGIVAISELVLRLRSFLLIPLITRAFGTVDYGVWAQVSLIAVTLSPVLAMGTNPAALRLLPGMQLEEQRRKFSAWLVFLIAVTVSATLPIIASREGMAQLFFGGGEEFSRFIPLAAISVVVSLMLDSIRTWYRIQKNAIAVSIIDISRALLNVLAVVAMLLRDESVFELVLYTISSDLVVLIFAIVIYGRNVGWAKPDFSILRPLLRFGIPLIPTGLAVWALNFSDRLIIVNFLDLAQLGIYGVAYSLGSTVIELFAKPLRIMLHPSLAELFNQADKKGLSRLFNYSVFALSIFCIPSIVGLFILGEEIISTISTPAFASGGQIIGIIALSYFLFKLAGNYGFIIGLANKPELQSLSTILAVVANLTLNFLLIPRIGILGAAVATLAAFLVNFISSYWYAGRERLVKIDIKILARIFAAALLMGVFLQFLAQQRFALIENGVFSLIFLVSIGAVFYSVLLYLLGVLSKERFSLARSILRGSN